MKNFIAFVLAFALSAASALAATPPIWVGSIVVPTGGTATFNGVATFTGVPVGPNGGTFLDTSAVGQTKTGALTVGGTLTASGAATVGTTLGVSGATTVTGSLTANSNLYIPGLSAGCATIGAAGIVGSTGSSCGSSGGGTITSVTGVSPITAATMTGAVSVGISATPTFTTVTTTGAATFGGGIGVTGNVTASGNVIGTDATFTGPLSTARLFDVMSPAYGAVCDGTTDDTSHINAALTAGAGQGVVLIPAGVTCAHTGLSVPGGSLFDIEGTLLLKSTATTHSIQLAGSNVHIWGSGTINGNSANVSYAVGGIVSIGEDNILIDGGLTIENTNVWGINIESGTTDNSHAKIAYVTIKNFGASNQCAGSTITGGSPSTSYFHDCQVDHVTIIGGIAGTATGTSSSTLTDSTQSWTMNQWAGYEVVTANGSYACTLPNGTPIASNTATALTLTSCSGNYWYTTNRFNTRVSTSTPAPNTVYAIVSPDSCWTFYGGVQGGSITNSTCSYAWAGGFTAYNDSSQPLANSNILFEGNTVWGIPNGWAFGVSDGASSLAQNSNISFVGNEAYGNGPGASAGSIVGAGPGGLAGQASLYISNATGVLASNNRFHNDTGGVACGIQMAQHFSGSGASNGITIVGNTISDEASGATNGTGICLDSSTSNVAVNDNLFYDDRGGSADMAYGLANSSGSNTTLLGNRAWNLTAGTGWNNSGLIDSVGGALSASSNSGTSTATVLPMFNRAGSSYGPTAHETIDFTQPGGSGLVTINLTTGSLFANAAFCNVYNVSTSQLINVFGGITSSFSFAGIGGDTYYYDCKGY